MIRINLLPRERVQRRPVAPRVLIVLVVGALAVATTAATLYLGARSARLRAQVEDVNAQIEELRPKVARVEQLRRAIEVARRKGDLLRTLELARVPWDLILDELRGVLPKDAWLTQVEMHDDGSMTFNGYALSYEAVARFMVSLEGSEMFKGIDMLISQKQIIAGRDVVNFSLTGTFVREQNQVSVR